MMIFKNKLAYLAGYNIKLFNSLCIIFGSILLAMSAQITLPILPVPVTLQSFAVLFIGLLFEPKISSRIVLAYLAEGALGLPVFANFSAGLPVLLGPSGGYLLGFLPAAVLFSYLLKKGWAKNYITIFSAALLSTLVLFLFGYVMLAKYIGFYPAYLFGIKPFYVVEICKIIPLTLIVPFFRKADR